MIGFQSNLILFFVPLLVATLLHKHQISWLIPCVRIPQKVVSWNFSLYLCFASYFFEQPIFACGCLANKSLVKYGSRMNVSSHGHIIAILVRLVWLEILFIYIQNFGASFKMMLKWPKYNDYNPSSNWCVYISAVSMNHSPEVPSTFLKAPFVLGLSSKCVVWRISC